jgi:hypothetical protein
MKIYDPKTEDNFHSNNYSQYCISCKLEINNNQVTIGIREKKIADSLEKLINKKKK